MKNVTASDRTTLVERATALGLLSQPVGQIPGYGKLILESGMNASQVYCCLTRHQIEEVYTDLDLAPVASAAIANPNTPDGTRTKEMRVAIQAVVDARSAGQSWGLIGVRFNRPESLVRRWFKESGTKSEGLRIGKGGRWLLNEPALYNGDRAVTGINLPAPMKRSEIRGYAARLDAMENLPSNRSELQALAKELGLKLGGGNAALAERIRAHLVTSDRPELTAEKPEATLELNA